MRKSSKFDEFVRGVSKRGVTVSKRGDAICGGFFFGCQGVCVPQNKNVVLQACFKLI